MSEGGCLVRGEAAVWLRAQRSEPRVRCGRRARSTRPHGFSLGLRCHHARPCADYGVAPLPLYLHGAASVAYIPSPLRTSASNLPIAIRKTPFHLKRRVNAQGFLALVFGILLFFFSHLRCVTFAHIRLRKKEMHCVKAPAASMQQPIPPCALRRSARALKRYPKQFRAGPSKSFPPNRLSQAANPLPLVVFL